MKPVDYVIIGVILLIVGLVIYYMHKSKKSGRKCIGCPDGGSCASCCSGCNGICGQGKK